MVEIEFCMNLEKRKEKTFGPKNGSLFEGAPSNTKHNFQQTSIFFFGEMFYYYFQQSYKMNF